jgi:hypothetical protein
VPKFRIAHINIRSVIPKKVELVNFLLNFNIDICSINETKLSKSKTFSIQNYQIIRLDRNSRGGGVCFVVKKSIKFELVSIPPDFNAECLVIKVTELFDSPVFIATYYNPPNVELKKDLLSHISRLGPKVLILGDLNSHHQSLNSKSTSASGRLLFEFLEDENFVVLNNDSPTYISDSKSGYSSILDLALVSQPLVSNFVEFEVQYNLNSDHLPFIVDFRCDQEASLHKEVKLIKWSSLAENMVERLPPELVNKRFETSSDLDRAADLLTQSIQEAIEDSTVIKKVKLNSNYLILPKYLKELVKEKNSSRKLFQRTRLEEDKKRYNFLNNQVKEEIKKFKSQKWVDFCNSINNLKTSNSLLWRKIKSLDKTNTRSETSVPNVKRPDDTQTNNAEEVAAIFADQLEEAFSGADDPDFDDTLKNSINSRPLFDMNLPLVFDAITKSEVQLALELTRTKGAPGEDRITNRVLKLLPNPHLEIITAMLNASIQQSHIPARWKKAVVIMLPKPMKDPALPSSYRPISLLNTFSKLLERVISFRIVDFCSKNNIFNIYQSGFRRHHQTNDQILRVTQAVKAGFNRNQKTGMGLVDIKGAFDSVWHRGILYKMKQYGFPLYLCLWVENYLEDRRFQVRVGQNTLSTSRVIKAGVPQGSVLGPILFNIFFNDITCVCAGTTELGLFADDLSVWYSSVNISMIQLKLQEFFDNLQLWLSMWRLKLSVNKTVFTIFNPSGESMEGAITLTYNDLPIAYDKNPKLLGVVLDPKLSFCKHADYIEARAESRANMLRSIRGKDWGVNTGLLLIIYKALIRSLIDYAPAVTITMCDTAKAKFERIQNKTVRAITKWPAGMTNDEMLEEYNIDKIESRALKLMDKYLDKAHSHNPLINTLINDSKIASALDEGLYCKLKKPHPTPLGKFRSLPADSYKSVAHL